MFDPFHSGARDIQQRTGERDRAILNGRLIADAVPSGARSFVAQQQYCALGWVSPDGDVWAAFVGARQGFAATDETGTALLLDLDGADPIPSFGGMRKNDQLGVLFIDLETRRRLRVNGRIEELSEGRLHLSVMEAFPNCPKYIQRRQARPRPDIHAPAGVQCGDGFDDGLAAWIAAADTFFVASAHPDGAVDASHRGGRPGFVELKNGELRIPDYPGNSMFATLGNFAVNPRAGLAFVDFQSNRQLRLTGDVRLDLDAGESDGETGGAGRWWIFSPRRWIVSASTKTFDWTLIDSSPFNP